MKLNLTKQLLVSVSTLITEVSSTPKESRTPDQINLVEASKAVRESQYREFLEHLKK